ncbi:hypothetical protein D3C81_1644750 [compost metagenome]
MRFGFGKGFIGRGRQLADRIGTDKEPVFITRLLPLFQHIPKCKKSITGMIKHRIQQYPDAMSMSFLHQFFQVLCGSEGGVNPVIIGSIVLVLGWGFKNRGHVDGCYAKLLEIRDFIRNALQGSLIIAIGINLVYDRPAAP